MSSIDSSPTLALTTESADAKNTAMVMWLLSGVFGVLAGLLFAFMQRSEPYVQAQAKECINWGITVLLAIIVGNLLLTSLLGWAVTPLVVIANALFALMGAIASSTGIAFSVPLKLRLLK